MIYCNPQPASELTPEEVGNMTDEQLEHPGLNLSVNGYTLIRTQVKRRKAKDVADAALPFNPRTDISADARYLWIRIFIWFWVIPVVLGLLVFLLMH
jgi:hypothetical protein